MFFSVIIPAYNVSNYIEQCIESVLKQNFSDYELLIINDGSTDNTLEICREISKNNAKLRIINQSNRGVSNARNTGLTNSKGKYIFFLDGDDLMCQGTLKYAYEKLINEPDILVGSILRFEDKTYKEINNIDRISIKSIERLNRIQNVEELLISFCKINSIPWAPYQNFYKLDLIKEKSILFKENRVSAEDCEFFFNYLRHVNYYILSDKDFAKYRMFREYSATRTISFKSVKDQLEVFGSLAKYFNKTNTMPICTFFANKYANIIVLITRLSVEEKKESLVKITEFEEILSFTKGIKYTISKMIWKVFGYDYGSKIIVKKKYFKSKTRG